MAAWTAGGQVVATVPVDHTTADDGGCWVATDIRDTAGGRLPRPETKAKTKIHFDFFF